MAQQPVIETERLILREVLPEDIDQWFEMDSNPEVHRYIGNNPVTNKEHLHDVLASLKKQYQENGIGRWAVLEKDSQRFIGWCGLKFFQEQANGHINFHEVGYRLNPKYWGKGYATEAAIAAVRYGFDIMNLKTIYAITNVENTPSKNVLIKAGLNYIEDFVYEGGMFDGMPCSWFSIPKEEWLARGL